MLNIPEEFLFATMVTLGAMILVSSIAAIISGVRFSRLVPTRKIDLEAEMDRYSGRPAETAQMGFFERSVLLPVAKWYANRDRQGRSVEEKLDLLFWPDGFGDMREYYMRKVFYTMAGFALGFLIFFLFQGTFGTLGLIFPPLFTYLGFRQPDSQINAMLNERREAMTFELKGLLDRLSIAYQAKNSLNAAIIEMLASDDQDGYIAAELRRAMNLSLKGQPLDETLMEASRRCNDLPLAAQIIYQLAYTVRFGSDLLKPLRDAGEMAMSILTTALIERGRRNEILMLLPLFIPLFGVAVAMSGPALFMFFNAFGR